MPGPHIPPRLCSSTHELSTSGELLRCPELQGHHVASLPHGAGDYRWLDEAATSEKPKLGNLAGKRCTSVVQDVVRAQEFRCQYDTTPHEWYHAHFAPDGTIRYWHDGADPQLEVIPHGHSAKKVPATSTDFFGDGAVEGKWTAWDPNEPPVEGPLSPELHRTLRHVKRKGARIAARIKAHEDAAALERGRLQALETPPVPAQSHFVCECGAAVAVGTAHSCNGWNARPMRSAGPLADEPYAKKIKARIEEQERIESWDEIYDDHLPPGWARRPPTE